MAKTANCTLRRTHPVDARRFSVKGSSRTVTLATIATCLAHTPARTEKDTLLERLLSDPDRLIVLVMSGPLR